MDAAADRLSPTVLPDWVQRGRFSAEEYQRMMRDGIVPEGDPFELIDGEVQRMASHGAQHIRAIIALTRIFVMAAGRDFDVSIQSSIRLEPNNEPEPDLALLRPNAARTRNNAPPSGADTELVIEVSDSTLRKDLHVKVPLYARHGLPEAWVIDLDKETIRVHRAPADGAYATGFTIEGARRVSPLALPALSIGIADLDL